MGDYPSRFGLIGGGGSFFLLLSEVAERDLPRGGFVISCSACEEIVWKLDDPEDFDPSFIPPVLKSARSGGAVFSSLTAAWIPLDGRRVCGL